MRFNIWVQAEVGHVLFDKCYKMIWIFVSIGGVRVSGIELTACRYCRKLLVRLDTSI